MFWVFSDYKGENCTLVGMQIEILDYNKLAKGMKIYNQEPITVFE